MTSPAIEPTAHISEGVAHLSGIDWGRFKTLSRVFSGRRIRLTYLKGMLEIMSPISREHETRKSTLSLLLEAWLRRQHIRFYRTGGFTLESEGYSSAEPDESYSLHEPKDVPDLLIEVIVTSGSINKLEAYRPFQVPEVWFWKDGKLRVFCLEQGVYVETPRSQLLPTIDLELLADCAGLDDQYEGVELFEQRIAI